MTRLSRFTPSAQVAGGGVSASRGATTSSSGAGRQAEPHGRPYRKGSRHVWRVALLLLWWSRGVGTSSMAITFNTAAAIRVGFPVPPGFTTQILHFGCRCCCTGFGRQTLDFWCRRQHAWPRAVCMVLGRLAFDCCPPGISTFDPHGGTSRCSTARGLPDRGRRISATPCFGRPRVHARAVRPHRGGPKPLIWVVASWGLCFNLWLHLWALDWNCRCSALLAGVRPTARVADLRTLARPDYWEHSCTCGSAMTCGDFRDKLKQTTRNLVPGCHVCAYARE
jgi:hypothetical protein